MNGIDMDNLEVHDGASRIWWTHQFRRARAAQIWSVVFGGQSSLLA